MKRSEPDGERVPLVSGDLGDANEDPVAGTELESVRALNDQIGDPEKNILLSESDQSHQISVDFSLLSAAPKSIRLLGSPLSRDYIRNQVCAILFGSIKEPTNGDLITSLSTTTR